jgi:hypothetical protein
LRINGQDLDPKTGDPQGYLNGQVSKDYSQMVGVGTSVQDLEFYGSAVPTVYGSFVNSFSYKNFSMDIGISYKFGYWFRRNSINYTNLLPVGRGIVIMPSGGKRG